MNNIFKNLPLNLEQEVFETLIQGNHVTIERIVSKGHTSEPDFWYDQQQNEWVMILQGEAILQFELSDDIHMKSGDYLNIPAHQKHRVKWTMPEAETFWLAIHY